ncbi:LLM class F420-dependent oxidoreductase [Streptomyces sp. NPDC005840]|uniref:LLM class F420-dependent oxidoreductase n=1 Tax=Streptomyces doudnae TaxID=3075536 RepID=A0ABD5EG28_9ACTN|nr:MULTISPECIES: LLM class F420-dependent oxidoreductase [unclassified Streptomyces]MDT0433332.1 LLM class F420-dependent oxidoreductase [Streptomyces sp. DSM 41981]MYQ68101.1 TIGR03557 family F420-dependent LLM class oxidoreductase [Streptomyces sp. SID4950]SCE43011.1 F420-dependent oxidoreductase, G6PDH family [Streptomyces sp. SolWspMP-5a-2]
MVQIGYTMMTEQAGPRDLVDHVVRAEEAGFDFSVASDHSSPWLRSQGHAPYVWSVLGAAAHATSRIPLMTYVTCPTVRYHPAVVAQKAATVQLLSEGRFRLGLGSGENLNEHVVGTGWPSVDVRHAMLAEAVEIIRALFDGGQVTHRGAHFDVDSARLWDLPEQPPPIGIAVSGDRSCALAGRLGDLVIATEPKRSLLDAFDRYGGTGKPRVGQLPVSYDPDRGTAIRRAHEQFRWFGLGWKVNSELPHPDAFASATRFVTEDDVADAVPCGDDPGAFVDAVRPYAEAGFTEIALVQIGGDTQERYLDWCRTTLLPALRREFGG